MATITEIWRYPVKSMAGERLDSCSVTEQGLEGDRRWAFMDLLPNRAGKFFNIKQHEGLMTYRARLVDGWAEVTAPDGTTHRFGDETVRRLWSESKRPMQLRELPGGNFDDAHVHIVNLASVEAFGLEAGMAMDPRRFRANLYVEGLEPYEELRWLGRRIRVGDAELEVVDRCKRCAVINRDPDTTEATPRLLALLAERHEERMGLYCQVVRPGRVAVGDHLG